MARVVKKKVAEPEFDIETAARDFRSKNQLKKSLEEQLKKDKDRLKKYVDSHGYEDEKGNRWFDLPDGTRLKHERRVSTMLDDEKTEEYLKFKGLWDDCIEVIEAISEEKVLRCNYDGEISDADLAGLYIERESWAFIP